LIFLRRDPVASLQRRSRSEISLFGFAVMLMSMTVAEEMHHWTGQKQQVRQRCQGVTGMRPEQIASQCRKKEANHESQFRMKETEGGVHGAISNY